MDPPFTNGMIVCSEYFLSCKNVGKERSKGAIFKAKENVTDISLSLRFAGKRNHAL